MHSDGATSNAMHDAPENVIMYENIEKNSDGFTYTIETLHGMQSKLLTYAIQNTNPTGHNYI